MVVYLLEFSKLLILKSLFSFWVFGLLFPKVNRPLKELFAKLINPRMDEAVGLVYLEAVVVKLIGFYWHQNWII